MVVLCSLQSIPPPSQTSSSSSSSSNPSLLTPRRAIILSYPAIGLAMASLSIFNTLPSLHHANAAALPSPEQLDDPQQEEARLVRIFQEASPSVVCIKDLEVVKNTKSSSFIEDGNAKEEGTGSGFIWDKFGHIVTNYHVVEKLATDKTGAQRCKVILADASGNNFVQEGKIIGFDAAYDLAVLKVDVDGHQIKPAIIGSSHDLRVGQDCFAIGNPYGYENTLTTGVVSGLGREIPSPNGGAIRGAIQTDAAINSGNSGGPLINSYGHVIGVNTATFTRKGTGTSSGVNFAIPIDSVVKTVPYLIVYGTPYSDRY